jgi:hypothetical protein
MAQIAILEGYKMPRRHSRKGGRSKFAKVAKACGVKVRKGVFKKMSTCIKAAYKGHKR